MNGVWSAFPAAEAITLALTVFLLKRRSLCAAERLHGKEPGAAPAPEHFKYTVPAPAAFRRAEGRAV